MTTSPIVELAGTDRLASWVPSRPMISAKVLELRRRKGLMATMLVLIVGVPILVIVIRAIYHAANPSSSGPTGSPAFFSAIVDVMSTFSFIAAATLGAAAGTTDLSDGVFRQHVITGRSRLALFFARIPAGLAIVVPLLAATFAVLCLVTAFAGTPNPTAVNVDGVSVPAYLSQSQFVSWAQGHPSLAQEIGVGFSGVGTQNVTPAEVPSRDAFLYTLYMSNEVREFNPPLNEMVKIGLWLELVAGVGYVVGLGLGVVTGQRTVATILVIILQIVLTPIAVMAAIPDFVNGQRLIVGVPLTQLRPVFLRAQGGGGQHNGAPPFGGHGALSIPPMPTWAMLAVIAGWLVLWAGLGARRMLRRDA